MAAGNFLVSGRPEIPAHAMQPPSRAQESMIAQFERHVAAWVRLGTGPRRELDRAVQKFSILEDQLSYLRDRSHALFAQFQPYSKARASQAADCETQGPKSSPTPPRPHTSGERPNPAPRMPPQTTSLRIDPKRLVFEAPPAFEASKYITDPLLKSAFYDPRVLLKPESQWPKTKLARVMASREEQFELFRRWDGVQSLHLLPAASSEARYRCGLFAVYKSDEVDRQILNPIPENARCFSISDSTLSLAHASLLGQIFIASDQNLVIGSDDLKDFYHGFVVSDIHAGRNHIHGVFRGSDFRGFNAYNPELDDQLVVGCFRSLAMGTSYAVETAQHAHSVLLQRASCLRSSDQVAYKFPFPRGPGFELLCIDDHAFLLLVSKAEASRAPDINRADLALFARAADMYHKAKLRTSTKKAVRNSYHATVLGGEIDGKVGEISAPKLRVTVLCALSFQLAVLGFATKEILSSLVGSWVYVIMFRRPFMSLIGELYHELANHQDGVVFALSHDSRQELLLLTLYAPCMTTDLRAYPLDRVFCTDASSYAAGACEARLPPEACLELLRHADHKGYHTQLKPQVSAYLEQFNASDFADDTTPSIPRGLTEGVLFDVCEVFRGDCELSNLFRSRGFTVHPGFDLAAGQSGDISFPYTMLHIIGLICRRVVAYIHISPTCVFWGNIPQPVCEATDPKATGIVTLARRIAFILHLCAVYGLVASCGQPLGSSMYQLSIFKRLRAKGYLSFKWSACYFGSPFRGASHWLVNREGLLTLSCRCKCPPGFQHLQLPSTFTSESVQKFSQTCRPTCDTVFGSTPAVGETSSRFARAAPLPLLSRIVDCVAACIQELRRAGPELKRPAHVPPRWIGDLGATLSWKTLLQYKFKRSNHININEELSYRSLLKHVGKTAPGSRFGVLLDSRVVIGCNAKGRSSSQKLNFYMSTALPYIAGCNLYPNLFHVGTHDNASDDPSRLKRLREQSSSQPIWLRKFLANDFVAFDVVRRADNCAKPLDSWARLAGLALALHLLNAQDQSSKSFFASDSQSGSRGRAHSNRGKAAADSVHWVRSLGGV